MRTLATDLASVALLILLLTLIAVPLLIGADRPERTEVTAQQFIFGKYSPIAVYDPKERELTITPAAPRDTLICIRTECKLAEEWVGK